jgi:hypothetical protein
LCSAKVLALIHSTAWNGRFFRTFLNNELIEESCHARPAKRPHPWHVGDAAVF